MKKITVLVSLSLAASFTFGQERISENEDNLKIKEIRENPRKYLNNGGITSDNLVEKPDKMKPIIGDGFIIHPNPSEDFQIHSLNKMSDQSSDVFGKMKARTLQYLEQKLDPRVKSSPEESYRSPKERNTNK